jgi:mRNA interferase MazF
VVSRDAINRSSPVVVVVPCTSARKDRRIYPSEVLLRAPEGGLKADSIALGGQLRAIAKTRLVRRGGALGAETMRKLDMALLITLDLPGQ